MLFGSAAKSQLREAPATVLSKSSNPLGIAQKREGGKPMSQETAVPKGPAPRAEGITVRKPMKYLETLLTTQTEAVLNSDGTKKHVTTVRRSVRR
jgi:hypothetical protein